MNQRNHENRHEGLPFFILLIYIPLRYSWQLLEKSYSLPQVDFLNMALFFAFFCYFLVILAGLKENLLTANPHVIYVIVAVASLSVLVLTVIVLEWISLRNRYLFFNNVGVPFWYVVSVGVGATLSSGALSSRRHAMVVTYLFMFALLVLNSDLSLLRIRYENLTHFGMRLFLGDSYAIWAVLVLIAVRRLFVKVSIFFITVISLLILQNRGALYGFALPATVYLSCIFFAETQRKRIGTVIGCTGIFCMVMLLVDFELPTATIDRMVSNVFAREDGSIASRQVLAEMGMRSIRDNFLFGDYGSQLEVSSNGLGGAFGSYIHDFRSLWRQFGLVPFALLVFSFFFAWFHVLCSAFRNRNGWQHSLLVLTWATIMMFGRTYTWPYACFGLAFSLRLIEVKSDTVNDSIDQKATETRTLDDRGPYNIVL